MIPWESIASNLVLGQTDPLVPDRPALNLAKINGSEQSEAVCHSGSYVTGVSYLLHQSAANNQHPESNIQLLTIISLVY